ncbi:MAG: M48 family metallopeptidase [Planktomarina sp.]
MVTTLTLDGNPPVDVRLIRSSRAKRLSLRVSQLDGAVRLTLPQRCSMSLAEEFLTDRADWVRKHVGNSAVTQIIGEGAGIPFLGVNRTVVQGSGRTVTVTDTELQVPAKPDRIGIKLQTFLKERARAAVVAATNAYADRLDVTVGRISLKDTRSRWGSCSSAGNINYSWRLIMAPAPVLNYVAAHEVAHRLEMNHSNRYWANVARIYPDYNTQRAWLRTNGTALHSYRFTT